ncbi:hypothetical protein F5146DRAFT_1162700 [Armillaria mellea]|nr:hypothetical protein F5146DRAFT_1162700 [Armillaria mellea]
MELTRASIHRLLESFDWISGVTHTRDFNALLHSNDPPTSLQSVDVKHSVENMEFISQKIQAALDLLGNAVMSLEAHMSRVQSLQCDYDVILSPIHRVPVDIIMEILDCTQIAADDSEGATFGGYNVFTHTEGPRLLGQVCSSWRDIVNGFPRLWATMTISIPNRWSRSRAEGYFMEMLEYALERTRGHPLEFLFEHHEGGPTEDYEIMNSCFDLMMDHSARWRRAGFIVLPFFLPCLSHFRGKIDWLEDAHVHCHAVMGQQPSSVTGFEIAPRLKSLHLTGIADRVRFSFPTTNLISFHDERAFDKADRYAEYIRIVRSSPNLISLSVHDRRLHLTITPHPSDSRITSESIQALSVSSATFMGMLDVPSLHEVVLKPTYGLPNLDKVSIKSLSELIQHSRCSLTRLSVINLVSDYRAMYTVARGLFDRDRAQGWTSPTLLGPFPD